MTLRSEDVTIKRATARVRTAVFSICSNNYVGMASALFSTCSEHQPDADLYLVLVDERSPLVHYPVGVATVEASSIGIRDFRQFVFRYDVMELNTAVKPFFILHLMQLGYERVVYLDPDIALLSPIRSVTNALDDGAQLVLTPHICKPSEGEAAPNDFTFMRAGIYNLGFLAVSACNYVIELMQWWCRRLEFYCVNDQPSGVFVDQKFADFFPAFVESTTILRSPGVNLAYWNLEQRSLKEQSGIWFADNSILEFFHFSGFDPRVKGLSKHTELFRGSLDPGLDALLKWYSSLLKSHGYGSVPAGAYAYDRLATGERLSKVVRKLFRDLGSAWSGDPFVSFSAYMHTLDWSEDVYQGRGGELTKLMVGVWRTHLWLRSTFALTSSSGAKAYRQWWIHNSDELDLDPRLAYQSIDTYESARPAVRGLTENAHKRSAPSVIEGVNVVGYCTALSGVGEAARSTIRVLNAAGARFSVFDVELNVASKRHDALISGVVRAAQLDEPVTIYHVNADQLEQVRGQTAALEGHPPPFRIGVPFWELKKFPAAWLESLSRLDEIWAPSRFIQSSLASQLSIPVRYRPLAVHVDDVAASREAFGLPADAFIVLCAYDSLSYQSRKNPRAAIQAFRKAFGHATARPVLLVIKVLNGLGSLKDELDGVDDYLLIQRTMARSEMHALIASCDVFLSLHRSEGFGLVVAEAMALGTPVVATDYSGTTDLISPETGFPVNYRLVDLQQGDYPEWIGQVWADADVEHAAWQLRRICEDAPAAAQIAAQAKQFIEAEFSLSACAKRLHDSTEYQ